MVETRKYRYPRREKLKGKKIVERLFSEGRSVSAYPLRLVYVPVPASDAQAVEHRAGVAVPKKKIRSAAKRNRVKRLLREAYRLNKTKAFGNTKGKFAFLILYLDKELPSFGQVDGKMKSLLKKFKEQVHEKEQG